MLQPDNSEIDGRRHREDQDGDGIDRRYLELVGVSNETVAQAGIRIADFRRQHADDRHGDAEPQTRQQRIGHGRKIDLRQHLPARQVEPPADAQQNQRNLHDAAGPAQHDREKRR